MLKRAKSVVFVSEPPYSAEKMQIRNRYMVDWLGDSTGLLIAVWDGSPGGTANCVNYAKLKCRPILRIDPSTLLKETV